MTLGSICNHLASVLHTSIILFHQSVWIEPRQIAVLDLEMWNVVYIEYWTLYLDYWLLNISSASDSKARMNGSLIFLNSERPTSAAVCSLWPFQKSRFSVKRGLIEISLIGGPGPACKTWKLEFQHPGVKNWTLVEAVLIRKCHVGSAQPPFWYHWKLKFKCEFN